MDAYYAPVAVVKNYNLYIYKKGVSYSNNIVYSSSTAVIAPSIGLIDVVACVAGDTISTYVYNNWGVQIKIGSNPSSCFIHIERIGN